MTDSVIRPVTLGDAEALAALYRRNRTFLQPWEPWHEESWYTPAGQHAELVRVLAEQDAGRMAAFVVIDDGIAAGQVTLSPVVMGASLSAELRFWVALDHNGRGLGRAAVREVGRYAFDVLGLHRLQTATLPHAIAAQHVLLADGYARIGRAPGYLRINGRWQDHVLFQRLAD